jgi:predicted dienelactone hydrolase
MIKYFSVLWLAVALGVAIAGCAAQGEPRAIEPAPTAGPGCRSPYTVGFATTRYGGVEVSAWYPSSGSPAEYRYKEEISSDVAQDGAPLAGCGTFPLIVFSHGFTGCNNQSIFITETLARSGYVVVAPQHRDGAGCGANPSETPLPTPTVVQPFRDLKSWSAATYMDRHDDVEAAIDGALADPRLKSLIDASRIGVAGHSLGGYTALGMVGAWPSWKDSRIRAALLFSPYALPYSMQKTLAGVKVPVMYQGAEGDVDLTPYLEARQGPYDQSNSPKYFVKLFGGDHLVWCDGTCAADGTVAACLQNNSQAKLIDDYAIGFFDAYLKGLKVPMLTAENSAVARYQHAP